MSVGCMVIDVKKVIVISGPLVIITDSIHSESYVIQSEFGNMGLVGYLLVFLELIFQISHLRVEKNESFISPES